MTTKAELLNQIKTRVATLDKRLMLRQISATLDHALKTIDAKMEEGDKWITTETGSHILVDGQGNIKGGAGGKFNGKPLNSMGGTKKFTKYETVAERANAEHEAKQKPAKKLSLADFGMEKIRLAGRYEHDNISKYFDNLEGDRYEEFYSLAINNLETLAINRGSEKQLSYANDIREFILSFAKESKNLDALIRNDISPASIARLKLTQSAAEIISHWGSVFYTIRKIGE